MKSKLPVSLVIPCYNRLQQTELLLLSIRQSDFECEIIVIDDCSKENLKIVIDKFTDLKIIYYRNEINSGPSFSRNKGIELASCDYIAFTDNDCTVAKDWLIRLHEYISNTKSKVAAVGGKVISKDNNIFSLYFTYHKILDPWYHNGQFYYVVTANAIFKKSALQEVGGFDTAIKKAGGEDPGLCFKLMKNNWEFLYNQDAIIIHDYEKGFSKLFKTFFNYGFGCSVQTKKYFKMPVHIDNGNFGGITLVENQ
jgi:glycosyltransferase involved in cell wall biosynthesis